MSVKTNLFVMGAMVLAWGLLAPQKAQAQEIFITVKSGGKELTIPVKLSEEQIGALVDKLNRPAWKPEDALTSYHGNYGGPNTAPIEKLGLVTPKDFNQLESWANELIKTKVGGQTLLPPPLDPVDRSYMLHDLHLRWLRDHEDPKLQAGSNDLRVYKIHETLAKNLRIAINDPKTPIHAKIKGRLSLPVFDQLGKGQGYSHLTGNPFGTPVKPWIYTGDKDGNYKIEDGTGKVEEGVLKVQDQLVMKKTRRQGGVFERTLAGDPARSRAGGPPHAPAAGAGELPNLGTSCSTPQLGSWVFLEKY